MQFKDFWQRTWRLTLFGVLAAFSFTLLYYLFLLLTPQPAFHFNILGVTGYSRLLYIVGALTIMPLIGGLFALLTAALWQWARRLFKDLDEKRRELYGLIAVAVVVVGVLGFPRNPARLARIWVLLPYLLSLGVAASLVLLAHRGSKVVRWGRRVAGGLLGLLIPAYVGLFFFGVGHFDYLPPEDDSPADNIVVILSDAHRADAASLYGGPAPTPNLERLAARGVSYDYCIADSNWTLPSTASLFTGTEQAVHGVDWTTPLSPLPTLADQLRRRGYRTWGLLCSEAIKPSTGLYRGFETYCNFSHRQVTALGTNYNNWSTYGFFLELGAEYMAEVFIDHVKRIPLEQLVELAGELPAAGGVFAYVHLYEPHDPYAPPQRYRPAGDYSGPYEESSGFFYPPHAMDRGEAVSEAEKAHIRGLYLGEVRYEDEYLGRFLDVLEARGLLDNTAVFYLSDHGEQFWEHGRVGHGESLHVEELHVPLAAYWPGELEGGLRHGAPVRLSDVYATILELSGVDWRAPAVTARPLTAPPEPQRRVFAEKLVAEDPAHRDNQVAVYDPRGTLILHRASGELELYLPGDYAQEREVGDEYPQLRRELLAVLLEYDAANQRHRRSYNPTLQALSGDEREDQLESLRSLGYIQ
jgi:arylsulfatase A-like enzyme